MIFGLSFGKKRERIDQTNTVDKTETMSGTQQQSTMGARQGSSSTTSSGSQTSVNRSDTSTATNQQQSDRGTQSTRGTTTTLDARVSDNLSATVQRLLSGGVTDANIASLSNMIAGTTGFNPEAMVAQTVDAARSRAERELQERNAAIQSNVGGTDTTNSMSALLAQQGRNSLERNIAEITAATTMQAEQIRNQNLMAGVQAQGGLAEQAAGLGGVLKGATTTVDTATLTDQLSQLLGIQNQSGTQTNTTENTQTQNTLTSELLAELANVLSNQRSNTKGTENVRGTTTKSGGGFSFGL